LETVKTSTAGTTTKIANKSIQFEGLKIPEQGLAMTDFLIYIYIFLFGGHSNNT
jgi:hypothetical protein